MAVPGFQDFMLPMLECIKDGNVYKSLDVIERVASILNLSDDDKSQQNFSKTQAVYYNRAMWARTFLKKAGLLIYPEKGFTQITQEGLELLNTKPKKITVAMLKKYAAFRKFASSKKDEQSDTQTNVTEIEKTPDEMIEDAKAILTADLEDTLLSKIMDNSPSFFEKLVATLLIAMGYGGSVADILQNTGRSGDEGIDGIIKQDRLGLDKIYIQAKRWTGSVSRPEIQKFVGAVHGKNASRGIFITTSKFTGEAISYVKNLNSTIILIDGATLTSLLVEYNVGVQIKDTIAIKKVDEDFFEEIV